MLLEISPPSERLIWSLLKVNITSKFAYVYFRGANLGRGGNIVFVVSPGQRQLHRVPAQSEHLVLGKTTGLPLLL